MAKIDTSAPKSEQKICVKCGFCCDGTLFVHASLNPGEIGNLPEKIERNSFIDGDKDYFRLPCLYFTGKCSIYGKKRAYVCSSYRCQLLKDLAAERITMDSALMIVSEASAIRDEILAEYINLSGKSDDLCFKQMPREIILSIDSGRLDNMNKNKYELLLNRCNILEALLIRHIRSSGDFKDLMTDSEGSVMADR